MRAAGPALRRLLHTQRAAKLARGPVAAQARRSVLMRELEDSRQEERADALESELPAGAADGHRNDCCISESGSVWRAAGRQLLCGSGMYALRCCQVCRRTVERWIAAQRWSERHSERFCLAVTELVWDRPLTILNYPDPRLRAPNAKIGVFDERLRQLAAEMFDLMYE